MTSTAPTSPADPGAHPLAGASGAAPGELSEQVKMYTLLVDQIQKYNTIVWQVPTALGFGNAITLQHATAAPVGLLALGLFDAVLAYAFSKMVMRQAEIVVACQRAEAELRTRLGLSEFIPKFKASRLPAPQLVAALLWLLAASVLVLPLLSRCCG